VIARRTCAPLLLAVGLLGTAACSALLDWNDFTGGVGDGGGGDGSHADGSVDGSTGDTGSDAPTDTTPMACGTAMQCTASAPELPEEVRSTLPGGIEEILFKMLEKSPDARPADAAEVLAKLAPFVSAGGRSTRAVTSHARQKSLETPSSKRGGDTMVSTPAPAVPRRADTVELVERATQPKQISTLVAVSLILLLSILAGLTAYVLRLRVGPGPEASGEPVPVRPVSAPHR